MSTLIYSSIGLSKADELEQYIKKAATQVPSNLFDIDEWINVIAIAKEVRTIDSVAARDEITSLRKNLNILHFISDKPLKNSREELQLLRKDVALQMQVIFARIFLVVIALLTLPYSVIISINTGDAARFIERKRINSASHYKIKRYGGQIRN